MHSCERGITDRATIPSLNSPFLTRLFEGTAGVCVYTDECVCGEPKRAARAEAAAALQICNLLLERRTAEGKQKA